MFTDIEGSTSAWDRHGTQMNEAMARHDAILREIVVAHDGSVFSHGGDGIAAVFVRATDAVEAACGAQRALAAERWPEPLALRVRIGLHTGVAELRDGNYFGSDPNRAARVMSLALGGQVLVTAATAGLVSGGPWSLVDRGRHRLRGFEGAEQIFQILAEGLSDVEVAFSSDDVVGNLPRAAAALIGRTDVLDQVQLVLKPGSLVTLVGVGGVGKTTLALAAARATNGYSDGAWFVDLTAASADADVMAATIAALGLVAGSVRMGADDIARALAGQARLIVLDNCEHVIEAVAQMAAAVRNRCVHCAVLATSREPLGLAGERVISVEPLDTTSDAIELLTVRIAAQLPLFEPTAADRATLEGICRLVDGVPLGIELAAARVLPLGLETVHAQLSQAVDLTDRRRGIPERHRSLRATVAWSYGLLTDDEQLLLDRLSAFAGTFDLAGASAVCGSPPLVGRVTDLLVALVDKSLVAVVRGGGGLRYRLLEIVRQFATAQLENRGEGRKTSERCVDYYVGWVERADARSRGPDEARWHHAYVAEWDNVRRVFRTAVANGNVDAALQIVWHCHGWARDRWYFEFGDWAKQAVAMPGASAHPAYPIALVALFWFHHANGNRAVCRSLLRQAQDHEASHGPAPEPVVPYALAEQAIGRGATPVAQAAADEIRRRDDSLYWRIQAAHREWSVSLLEVTVGDAEPDLEEATRAAHNANVRLAEQLGNPTLLARAYHHLACVEPDADNALVLLEQAIAIAQDVSNVLIESWVAVDLVRIYCKVDRAADALAIGQSVAARCRRAHALNEANYMGLSLLPALVGTGQYDRAAVVAATAIAMKHTSAWRRWFLPDDIMAALRTAVGPERLEGLADEFTHLDPAAVIDRLHAAIDNGTDTVHN